jgi:hypothetical protein
MTLCGALWALEAPVRSSTKWYGDNLGMLQSTANPDSTRKKRCVIASYHMCRVQVPAGVRMPNKVRTGDNITKMETKALEVGNIEDLGRVVFARLFYGQKDFVLRKISIWYKALLKYV